MTAEGESTADDPLDLGRFVAAQADVYQRALSEIRRGEKQTHWMWFVFPQLAGLGTSEMARRYAIRSVAEAEAYLGHAILGPRLVECAHALLAVEGRTARQILGSPDDLKLQSCATLFARVAHGEMVFAQLLERFFAGRSDLKTVELLQKL